MTAIKIVKKFGHIQEVTADGHTGYGVEGEDIVCAAVSSVIQTALLGLMMVASINVEFKRDDKKGFLFIRLPADLDERDRNNADMILETMLLGIADLNEGFSDFIELEVN